DDAVLEREERPIATGAGVAAGVDSGAAQTHDDAAGEDGMAAEALYAESLRVALATVAGCSLTFFMRHDLKSPQALMDSILMTESSWRWPRLRSMPLRFFFLKTTTFSPRFFSSTLAETEAPER